MPPARAFDDGRRVDRLENELVVRGLAVPLHDAVQLFAGDCRAAFDGTNVVLWATALDPDRPGRKTVARAHLEENGRLLLHRHYLIDDKGTEHMMIELRMTKRGG